MSAKLQLEKEIRQAVVFLREHNQTIPSDTIEFMKVASLEKLRSLEEPHIIVLGNPETIKAFMHEFNKAVYSTGLKTAKGDEIKIGDTICTDGLFIGKQPESFWGEIRSNFIDDGIVSIDAWQTPDDNEEGTVIAKVNKTTGEVQYIDDRAKTDNYAQQIIAEVLAEIYNGAMEESGAPENFSDLELEEYLAQWGQSHREITSALGLRPSHADSDEILMEDYFYLEGKKKWYPKSSSMYSPREQKIAEYIRSERDKY